MLNRIINGINGFDNRPALLSIRRGFLLTIPVIIAGCIPLLILNFPIPQLRPWLDSFAGGFLTDLLLFIYDSTIGLMSAYITLAISYYYADYHAGNNTNFQILAMINALACYAASFGGATGSLTLSSFGTTGVFTAILCAIASTRIFFAMERHTFKRFSNSVVGADIHYRTSATSIVPMLITITIFALLNMFLTKVLNVNNINELITNGLSAMFENISSELGSGLLFILMNNLLWFFGIHGGNALDPVANELFVAQSGEITSVMSKSFFDNFALIGGSGATICLVLALLIASRSRGDRQIAKSALPLTFFNINELLVYGLPVILNPIMLIPFVVVPIISLLIGYGAVTTGLMPMVAVDVQWTTPPLISGYLATGSISGSVVQLIIVAVGTGIYIPFIRLLEQVRVQQAAAMMADLTKNFMEDQRTGNLTPYLTRRGSDGSTARAMVAQLRLNIEADEIPMYYQPQFDVNERIVGAEALLRWSYAGQRVYPPLVIALAHEDGSYEELTWSIIRSVLRDAGRILNEIDPNMHLSVNITAEQLSDESFVNQVIELIKGKNIGLDLVFEVTEESSLDNYTGVSDHINILNDSGISMAIDDFSMGQTSLNFLHSNRFQYVKLDGQLVKQVVTNPRCYEIIASIVALGKSLDFEVVAEYVENREIRDTLISLGCQEFQGYLYSPAIPLDDFIEFCNSYRRDGE